MKDWLGRAWDFVVQSLGGQIARQRWTDYKQWTDFSGSWLAKVEYKSIDLNEEIRNPSYKFFWWWLRYAVLIIGGVIGRIKAFVVIGVRGVYRLDVLGSVRSFGSCVIRGIYRLNILGRCKVQGVISSWFKYWLYPLGLLKILGKGLAIVRIPLQILGLMKLSGICNLIIRILVSGSGNIKIQSNSCVSQYVSWQHFGTWQDWANATNGKWYYKC
jgi:hypothetical protein